MDYAYPLCQIAIDLQCEKHQIIISAVWLLSHPPHLPEEYTVSSLKQHTYHKKYPDIIKLPFIND